MVSHSVVLKWYDKRANSVESYIRKYPSKLESSEVFKRGSFLWSLSSTLEQRHDGLFMNLGFKTKKIIDLFYLFYVFFFRGEVSSKKCSRISFVIFLFLFIEFLSFFFWCFLKSIWVFFFWVILSFFIDEYMIP